MDTREKLVKQAISHFWYGVSHDIFSEPVTTYAKLAIDALEKENGVTVQEWISVKDRLPEVVSIHKGYRSTIKKSIRVLCVCVQKSGKTMVKEGYCEWYNDDPEPRWQIPGTIDKVTHWQYLPQPPKVV